MGGIMGALRGMLAGVDDVAGNQDSANQLNAANQRAIDLKNEQRKVETAKLHDAWQNAVDIPNGPTAAEQRDAINERWNQLYPPHHAHHFLNDIMHVMGGGKKPQAPVQNQTDSGAESDSTVPTATNPGAVLQGATPVNPQPASNPQLAQVQQVAKKARTPDELYKIINQTPGPAQTSLNLEQARAKAMIDEIYARNQGTLGAAEIRAHGNIAKQKLDKAVADLSGGQYMEFESAPPEIAMQAVSKLSAANRAPSWKPFVDGNSDVWAVDARDPSKKQLLGHRSDLTTRLEYKTMTNPDGKEYQVPFTVWSKRGSTVPIMETQGIEPPAKNGSAPPSAAPGATPPVSSATPAPPTLAATNADAVNGKLNRKKPQSKQLPTSSNTPDGVPKGAIPFGAKESPEAKSYQQQWTKVANDANQKEIAWNISREAAKNPTPSSDQELIYSWVRTNVQGAGRMTQAEFKQAGGIGSVPTKTENWISLATSGKMTPEIRNFMLADVKRSAEEQRKQADTLKAKMDAAIHPGKTPVSSSTPAGPGAEPKVLKFNPVTGKLE